MTRFKRFAAVAALVLAAAIGSFQIWKRGTPYGPVYRSPNGEYHVQKYSNWMLPYVAGPGQGSDAIGGYIRLFRRDGTLVHERFQSFTRDVEPVWSREKVYLKGIADMDTNPWILPSSSE